MTENKKKQVDLRIQFIHRPLKRRWFIFRKYPFLIQNEPFEYGVKIKNIGKTAFAGAVINSFIIQFLSVDKNLVQNTSAKPNIAPLNPNEEIAIYFDRYTLWHEGSLGLKCELIPTNADEILQTFQHHRDHDSDEPYRTHNEWWQDYYCQGELQLLQSRTNNLILLLTVITVLEAIFGLKKILKFLLEVLVFIFSSLTELFSLMATWP